MDWALDLTEVARIACALVLCGLIGLERQFHQKSAGVRTHVLVGMGAALFTVISMHTFTTDAGEVIQSDPTRIAAQIVSGIGFLGAGLIFVNRDAVRGLTTAASVWLSAAIGMACGADMVALAAVVTAMYLVFIIVLSPLIDRIPTRDRNRLVRITYVDGEGRLRAILTAASDMEFESQVVATRQRRGSTPPLVEVDAHFNGKLPLRDLVVQLAGIDGVHSVDISDE